ncbi:MAG: RNA polymerase sigma factor [Minisyncoccales bacterium]
MDNDKIKELVSRSQNKDREAFAELFDLYYDKVLNYVFRRTLDVDYSKDITSNVFLKVLKNLDKFEWRSGPFSFTAWIFRIAINEINQYFRSQNKYKSGLTFDLGDDNKAAEEMEKKMDNDQYLMILNKAIRRLKPVYQEIINLRYFEDLSYEEISEVLKKNESTVRVYSKRAREDLEKILKQDAFKFLEKYDF